MLLTALLLCCSSMPATPDMTDMELLSTSYLHVHSARKRVHVLDPDSEVLLLCVEDKLLELVRRTVDRQQSDDLEYRTSATVECPVGY